jgi:N-acetylglucosaminyldiphosphoundecaprenol N-acetyl-beta-D-mannosaminyltransferase
MDMDRGVKMLGVRIDNFSIKELKENILQILDSSSEQKFVTTLNPEILLKAHRDESYRSILNSADLNICDGFGIKLAGFFRNNPIKSRLTGADLVVFLLEKADQRKLKVSVLAAKNSLSAPSEIEQALKIKYPDLSIKSEYFSPSQDFFKNDIIESAEIIFVSFGAPEQEKFIFENRTKFSKAKILIGVGGAFDFITGKFKRAPKALQKMGLEWIWRLIQEPKRMRRICRAVIIFPFLVLTKK